MASQQRSEEDKASTQNSNDRSGPRAYEDKPCDDGLVLIAQAQFWCEDAVPAIHSWR